MAGQEQKPLHLITSDTAYAAFQKKFRGQWNLITDDWARYYEIGPYFVELSGGKFMDVKLFGVTVLEKENLTHRHDLSKPFDTQQAAEAYIHELRDR